MKQAFNLFNINSVRPLVREALRYAKYGSALDLGCGVGRHALFLAKHGFRVTAVDERTEVLAALKELARLQKLPITVRRGDAAAFSSSKKFDMVLSTMVLHFLPESAQRRAITLMQRLTKAGGVNVISSYTNKNRNGTRPHLIRAGLLKQSYARSGWNIRYHEERLSDPMPDSSGKTVRYWIAEIIAEKP